MFVALCWILSRQLMSFCRYGDQALIWLPLTLNELFDMAYSKRKYYSYSLSLCASDSFAAT